MHAMNNEPLIVRVLLKPLLGADIVGAFSYVNMHAGVVSIC